jgi:perosamine synthetase|tara:strand:+ start:6030 stop:7118 length:1089 start_codon:yes stop_codon:yes gene_type:complete
MSRKINQVEPNISEEDIQKVNDYMSSGAWITEHALTKELEKKIADFVDRKYAIAVPNGTIAIYLSLLAAGLTKGKRVAVPNITMIATINAILWAGAEPVIIDLNERLCMSIKSLQTVEKLDGVIYVPLNGRTEDGIAIEEYCNEKDIILIEDSAHALGSQYQDKMCGSLGRMSVFSFTPHKIITMGQGGLVLTDEDNLYEYLIELKTFNRSKDRSDWHDGFGLNFKITDLQSALGLSQFEKINDFIKIKKEMFQLYKNKISGYKFINFFDYETPWFIDLICESESDRDNLKDLLERQDILTRESYPALSKQSFLQSVEKTSLKFSENISENILWLPSSTNLTKNQIEQVSDKIEISDLAKGF